MIYDDETEVTRAKVVEVVDVNKPSKGRQIDMFRQRRKISENSVNCKL